ncbi:general secretion pathway protein GspM [Roseateles chitinivorans]|uniref:General secretion pathway protein GspM n=1 Tax=Roseateles chitinivorans TaxID=2917965 RepID=A0A2G9CDW8_9BURK|nr:type II secretion system protein GspM [Roseateles chitinivorans]PIM54636.1 general secretion pathway protein GspM [Roseateles chitinivorans]
MNSFTTMRRDLDARWQAAAPRERLIARLAAVFIGLLLLWLIALAPAWSTLRKAPGELDRLDRELQQMRAMALQTQALKQAVPVSAEQSVAALRAATARLGPAAELTITGTQAQLRLRGVPGGALAMWIGEARQGARARPQEAELQSGPQGYSGRLTLLLPAAAGN